MKADRAYDCFPEAHADWQCDVSTVWARCVRRAASFRNRLIRTVCLLQAGRAAALSYHSRRRRRPKLLGTVRRVSFV